MKIKIHGTLDELKKFYLGNNSNIINPQNFSIDDVIIDDKTVGTVLFGGTGSESVIVPSNPMPYTNYCNLDVKNI